MTDLKLEVGRLMLRELETFAREVEMFPDDATLWKTLPGLTNSAGNLGRHVCGNLKHFVGAVLGGTGYVRQRDAEFAAREGTREAVARELRETRDVVSGTLSRVPESVLEAPYPEAVGGVVPRCDRFLIHLATHLAFHLGQAGYLRRALTGDARTTGAVAVKRLVDES
jgi:hypothetical protein